MRALHPPSGWKMTRWVRKVTQTTSLILPRALAKHQACLEGLKQSQQREAKHLKVEREESTKKRKREDGREMRTRTTAAASDEATVGEFEVNQEADDVEDEGELENCHEDVYDEGTGADHEGRT